MESELTRIILGPHSARAMLNEHDSFNTSIDDQATIKFLPNNRPQPAQYLIDEIKRNITRLHREGERLQKRARQANPTLMITFTWVAGHMGSEGNEAAEFGSSDQCLLPNSFAKNSPSAYRQPYGNSKNKPSKTTKWWKQSKQFEAFDPKLPGSNFIKATKGLSRRQISVLTQMRTGHIEISKHLQRIHRVKSPKCSHCPNADEDVNHLLLRYRNRHHLTLAFTRNAFSIQHLLSD